MPVTIDSPVQPRQRVLVLEDLGPGPPSYEEAEPLSWHSRAQGWSCPVRAAWGNERSRKAGFCSGLCSPRSGEGTAPTAGSPAAAVLAALLRLRDLLRAVVTPGFSRGPGGTVKTDAQVLPRTAAWEVWV